MPQIRFNYLFIPKKIWRGDKMCVQRWPELVFLLIFTLCTTSCGEADNDDSTRDLRVVTQADVLRAQLGQSTTGSFTLVNPSTNPMQFTIESHAPETLLTTAVSQGMIAPKSAIDIAVTATCPLHDGQFLMKLTATNDVPGSNPTEIFLRLQCGWVAAAPETIGNLFVGIEGLAEHIPANIRIEGPDDFQDIVDATITFRGLPIGRYVLTADPVTDDENTYVPAPLIFSLIVTNDNKARANFTYSLERDANGD